MDDAILYLDTKDISDLARRPDEPGPQAVLEVLREGRARLGVSLLHFLELSAPNFVSRGDVGRLLDSLPLAWTRFPMDLFAKEIDAAIGAVFGEELDVSVWSESMEESWRMPATAVLPPSEALESMAETPALRAGLLQEKERGARIDRAFKSNAAVAKDPLIALELKIRDEFDLTRSPSGLALPRRLTPQEVIEAVGGLEGFPGYQVYNEMARLRLRDDGFPTQGNDIVDELHACYGPYSAVFTADRRTHGRLRTLGLPFVAQSTRHLAEVPQLLQQWEAE